MSSAAAIRLSPNSENWIISPTREYEVGVVIAEKNEVAAPCIRDECIYVPLPDKTEYFFRIRCLSESVFTIADVIIELDGVFIGRFRLHEGIAPLDVRRAVLYHDNNNSELARVFVFNNEKSKAAKESGIEAGHKDNGLVKITILPKRRVFQRTSDVDSYSCSLSSGATTLGRRCDQRFDTVETIRDADVDSERRTIIKFRLVCEDSAAAAVEVKPVALRKAIEQMKTPPRID